MDGAGWRGVYDILKNDGFEVSIVQNPAISLAGDPAATKLILDSQTGSAILVGHSYGGAVITEAGTHPNVAGLVHITAFAPDKGESVNRLIAVSHFVGFLSARLVSLLQGFRAATCVGNSPE